ncbi:MAG: glutamate-5-semialdehyde dehydrogenase [Candidatus Scalindua sp.]|jgi:glutamate-5-semialdehyde dehydrogenase|nr:glutamate-5-semialdehyde dehydrogenase [Candidatus Scalindua sp.]MBT6230109.1 glutamate-5-semialdehyde dehydrogenase [Candidatus Scalindua sp.]MBT6561431.1 glutamate-5-semialdehyde dehydrogenase [Candidatus Scalindua sp.]MBT7212639.1 glutamate-5-semialdehyde dehydrogenase [Candidatus Scalindua sp.]MBT7591703.1 glutamate-5-semialdehyde dehydrogenase [Candidatus Scalindua sp.]
MNVKAYVDKIVRGAKKASRKTAIADTSAKNAALEQMALNLINSKEMLMAENEKDIKAAEENGLSSAMIDRLKLTGPRIDAMAEGIREVINLSDPVGEIMEEITRPNGLGIQKIRVPIGVIIIIYESRPNVTADAASLCLKTGNATILRGGKESIHSNIAIYRQISSALEEVGFDKNAIQVIETVDREAVGYLLKADEYADLVIPRGGEGLIRNVVENSTIPVIKHYKGVCHVYVDEFADPDMARGVCLNSKLQRPGTCNAMETMLVHEKISGSFLPDIYKGMSDAGVELRGCEKSRKIVSEIEPATEEDWSEEYLEKILSVKVVSSIDDAIEHISAYGSSHSEAIITEDKSNAKKFTNEVDSAAVYVNASTRFTDGFEFGMGAEIGISTDKLHARGPMGLKELTSYKYIIRGTGQLRQ